MSALAARLASDIKAPGRYPTPTEYLELTKSVLEHYRLPVAAYDLPATKQHFVRSIGYWYAKSRLDEQPAAASAAETEATPVDQAVERGAGAIEIRRILADTFESRRLLIKTAGQQVGVDQVIANNKFFLSPEWVRACHSSSLFLSTLYMSLSL